MNAERTWIRVGMLIDGTGAHPRKDVAVLIEDDRISRIVDDREVGGGLDRDGATVVDARRFTAIPGLIDAHVHLVFDGGDDPAATLDRERDQELLARAAGQLQRALASGITTLRDCGDRGNVTLVLRDAVQAGLLAGSRLLVSGMPITTTGGHLHYMGIEAEGELELQKAVRGQVKAGVDFVKFCGSGGGMTPSSNFRAAQYTREEMRAIVAEAHRLNRRVASHLHATEAIRNAVESGVDTIEHCSWLGSKDGFEYDRVLVDRMVAQGQFVVVTIGTERKMLLTQEQGDRPEHQPERFEMLRSMWDAGVRMVFATDAGVAHTGMSGLCYTLEAAALKMGISRLEALRTATATAAEALGVSGDLGTLEVGKIADLVLVDGDPTESLLELQKVARVYMAGRLVADQGCIRLNGGSCR